MQTLEQIKLVGRAISASVLLGRKGSTVRSSQFAPDGVYWWQQGLVCVTIGRHCRCWINRRARPLQMSLLLSSDTSGLPRLNCFNVWKPSFYWTSAVVIFSN